MEKGNILKMSCSSYESQIKITRRIDNLWWSCHDKKDFSLMEKIMDNFKPELVTDFVIVSVMSTLSWGSHHMPDKYKKFADRCCVEWEKRGRDKKDLTGLLEPRVDGRV